MNGPMNDRYPTGMIVIHWVMAATMIAAFILGKVMEEMPDGPEKIGALGWHALAGLLVVVLAVPRFIAVLRGAAPPTEGPRRDVIVAKAVQGVLYLTMLALPVLGMTAVLTSGAQVSVAGLVDLPAGAPSESLHALAGGIHGAVAMLFLLALVLHVAGAMKHALILRDGTLARMIPFLRR